MNKCSPSAGRRTITVEQLCPRADNRYGTLGALLALSLSRLLFVVSLNFGGSSHEYQMTLGTFCIPPVRWRRPRPVRTCGRVRGRVPGTRRRRTVGNCPRKATIYGLCTQSRRNTHEAAAAAALVVRRGPGVWHGHTGWAKLYARMLLLLLVCSLGIAREAFFFDNDRFGWFIL